MQNSAVFEEVLIDMNRRLSLSLLTSPVLASLSVVVFTHVRIQAAWSTACLISNYVFARIVLSSKRKPERCGEEEDREKKEGSGSTSLSPLAGDFSFIKDRELAALSGLHTLFCAHSFLSAAVHLLSKHLKVPKYDVESSLCPHQEKGGQVGGSSSALRGSKPAKLNWSGISSVILCLCSLGFKQI